MTTSQSSSSASTSTSPTHYDVLQISSTASQLDIKKAYRRLALQYHPDRNSDPNAKQRFQQVGQAYACLSDPVQRREYDRQLQQQEQHQHQHAPVDSTFTSFPSFSTSHSTSTSHYNYSNYHPRNPVVVDPWTQFDFLFHNDPFFRDYFDNPEVLQKELDDLRLAAATARTTNPSTTSPSTPRNTTHNHYCSDSSRNHATPFSSSSSSSRPQQEGWIPWLLRQCGIQFTMTTIVQDGHGRIHAKQISSSQQPQQRQSSARRHGSISSSSVSPSSPKSTTIQQETLSYMENGQRVWIKKRQLQGTLIEDKIVGTTLVERKINGVVVPHHHYQQQQQLHQQQQQ